MANAINENERNIKTGLSFNSKSETPKKDKIKLLKSLLKKNTKNGS